MEKENNNQNKLTLPMIIVVLATLVIAVIAVILYMQKINSDKEIARLKSDANQLQSKVSELQGKLDNISNIASTNDESSDQEKIENVEKYSETEMLKLFSDSSDMRVTSINKVDNKFLITVNYYVRVKITEAEFKVMKDTGKITIDDTVYEYSTNSEESPDGENYGIIKSTNDNTKIYYVSKIQQGFEFQSKDGEGYDLPLTKFNKKFQYEANDDYIVMDYSNSENVTKLTLKELDSKWINTSIDEHLVGISRGTKGNGSELVIY